MSIKTLCALVTTPDGQRVLCRVIDYPIFNAVPPYKPLMTVRPLRGMPFYPLKEVCVEMDWSELKFEQVPS